MNCMETRVLVEDALDESLSGKLRRALDLHLSRCDKCREFFAAEREEHRIWFRAMNEPRAQRRLPDGFADAFLAKMTNGENAPRKRSKFARLFRRIAAALAAMLLFAGLSYAAAVAVVEERSVAEESWSNDAMSVSPESADSGESASSLAIAPPDDDLQVSGELLPAGKTTGEANMDKTTAAATVLSAALSTAPSAASGIDAYQYIISTPYPEANMFHSNCSSAIALDSGAVRVAGIIKGLEARSRTAYCSCAIALNATEFKALIITVR